MGKKKKNNDVKIKRDRDMNKYINMDITKDIININDKIQLKEILRDRDINTKAIPNPCSLKEVLINLKEKNWNVSKLKKYEKNCYEAYKINNILPLLRDFEEKYWPEIVRINVLSTYGEDIGSNCVSMYLVGYVAENLGIGEHMMSEYCKITGITEKEICIKAIYNTGKIDGEYLKILNKDGSVADWDFFERWVMG